jgi:hypothetical protein
VNLAQRGDRGRAGERIAEERSGVNRLSIGHRPCVHDLAGADARRDRQRAGQSLSHAQEIGNDLLVLTREPVSGPSQAGIDFVSDQEQAAIAAQISQPGQEAARRHHVSAPALDGLYDHGTDGVAFLRVDESLDVLQCCACEIVSIETDRRSVRIRVGSANDVRVELVGERATEQVPIGDRERAIRQPVIRSAERDHPRLPGSETRGLECHFHGLGPRTGQHGS